MTGSTLRDRKPPVPAIFVPAGNTATGWLKLIALVFMFIDHSGKVLFGNMAEMRALGRIAFPLYIWCMVVGFYRTRNVSRYLIRVMLTGLISQPLYLLALDYEKHVGVLAEKVLAPLSGGFSFPALGEVLYTVFMAKPNIFLTLLLGLTALCAIRDKDWLRKVRIPGSFLLLMTLLALLHDGMLAMILEKIAAPFAGGFSLAALWESLLVIFFRPPNYLFLILMGASLLWRYSGKERRMGQIWGPAAMLMLATVLKADYGWRGVLFFILMYAAQGSRPALAAVTVSFLLFWGSSYAVSSQLFGIQIRPDRLPAPVSEIVRSLLRNETFAMLGLPLMLMRFPGDIRLPKWVSYLLYPGHLLLLILLKILLYGWAG